MSLRFKALILALALAVLPLRGIAAVAMWCCAQNQQAGLSAEQSGHGHGEQHAHGEEASHNANHGDNDSHDHGSTPSASACGGCVAGCVGVAVVSAGWASTAFPSPGASRIPFLERAFSGIVPAQLERPPLVQSL